MVRLFYGRDDGSPSYDENEGNFPPPAPLPPTPDIESKVERGCVNVFLAGAKSVVPDWSGTHIMTFVRECAAFYWGRHLRRLVIEELIRPLWRTGDDIKAQDGIVRSFLRNAVAKGLSKQRYCFLLARWIELASEERGLGVTLWHRDPQERAIELSTADAGSLLSSLEYDQANVFMQDLLGELTKALGFLLILALPALLLHRGFDAVRLFYGLVIYPGLFLLGLYRTFNTAGPDFKWEGLAAFLVFPFAELLILKPDYYAIYQAITATEIFKALDSPFSLRDVAALVGSLIVLYLLDMLFHGRLFANRGLSAFLVFIPLVGAFVPLGHLVFATLLQPSTGLPLWSLVAVIVLADLLSLHWSSGMSPYVERFIRSSLPWRLRQAHVLGDVILLAIVLIAAAANYDVAPAAPAILNAIFGRVLLAVSIGSVLAAVVKVLFPGARVLQALDTKLNVAYVHRRAASKVINGLMDYAVANGKLPYVHICGVEACPVPGASDNAVADAGAPIAI